MSISKLSGDFPVNSTLTNNQDRSAVIALADGRFFVTWTDDQASGVDPSGLGIWGAWFNADGSRSIDPFVMNPTTNANQNNSAAAQLSNGNVVVAWQDGSQTAGDNSLTAIRARILGPNGAQLVGEIVLNSTTANLQTQVSLAALPDGGFVATFTDHSAGSGDNSGQAVRARIFNSDGTERVAEFVVNTTTANDQNNSAVRSLPDGRFIVTWTDDSNAAGDATLAVRARIFNADGTENVPEFLVNTTTASAQFDSQIVVLSDGRVAVVFSDGSQSPDDPDNGAIRCRIFNADGVQSVAEFRVNQTTASDQSEPSVTALVDGRFMVTWTDASGALGDASGNAVVGRLINNDGTASTPDFLINTATLALQSSSSVTTLANGTVVVTWTDSSQSNPYGNDIRAQRFDPKVWIGTAAGESMNGGTLDDTISGMAGADTLDGRAGDDAISGGDGADTLTGGTGFDQLEGGADADVLSGGLDNDRLAGGAGLDQLNGDEGNDRLFGDDGDDTLNGGAGEDFLDGGLGSDVMLGGGGHDHLDGGHGNDSLTGDDGDDRVFGWLGQDSIEGGTGNDSLFGEQGSDTLRGDAGNDQLGGHDGADALFGLADDDTLWGDAGNDSLYGGVGSDQLFGFADNDLLDGEDGADELRGGQGLDSLLGGSGADTLFGEADADLAFGWLGADLLWGGDGNDTLWGEQDNDTLLGETGNDVLLGVDGDDLAYGWLGNDSLYGWTGNDVLFGEQGNDLILGEDGNDTIVGGLGRDTMTGGAGADRFFSANFEIAAGEVDLISDFDVNDRYLFQTGAQLQYFSFNAPGYGAGAGIHVQVAGGVFILDVFGATTAQLQAQTQFF